MSINTVLDRLAIAAGGELELRSKPHPDGAVGRPRVQPPQRVEEVRLFEGLALQRRAPRLPKEGLHLVQTDLEEPRGAESS